MNMDAQGSSYGRTFGEIQQQITVFRTSLETLGLDSIHLAGSILEKETAYAVLCEDYKLAHDLDLAIERLRHLRLCLPRS